MKTPLTIVIVQLLSCAQLCDPVDFSTPGLPVICHLPELTQTHIHWVCDAKSNHLILCCPLIPLPSVIPSIRVFSNESDLCNRWPKYWSFSFSISPSSEYSGLYGPTLTFIHDYLKIHSFDYTDLWPWDLSIQWLDISKETCSNASGRGWDLSWQYTSRAQKHWAGRKWMDLGAVVEAESTELGDWSAGLGVRKPVLSKMRSWVLIWDLSRCCYIHRVGEH